MRYLQQRATPSAPPPPQSHIASPVTGEHECHNFTIVVRLLYETASAHQ